MSLSQLPALRIISSQGCEVFYKLKEKGGERDVTLSSLEKKRNQNVVSTWIDIFSDTT